jgi:hypothetical protein
VQTATKAGSDTLNKILEHQLQSHKDASLMLATAEALKKVGQVGWMVKFAQAAISTSTEHQRERAFSVRVLQLYFLFYFFSREIMTDFNVISTYHRSSFLIMALLLIFEHSGLLVRLLCFPSSANKSY